jgi:hypothetical protein
VLLLTLMVSSASLSIAAMRVYQCSHHHGRRALQGQRRLRDTVKHRRKTRWGDLLIKEQNYWDSEDGGTSSQDISSTLPRRLEQPGAAAQMVACPPIREAEAQSYR